MRHSQRFGMCDGHHKFSHFIGQRERNKRELCTRSGPQRAREAGQAPHQLKRASARGENPCSGSMNVVLKAEPGRASRRIAVAVCSDSAFSAFSRF